jgi:hypothetical protein
LREPIIYKVNHGVPRGALSLSFCGDAKDEGMLLSYKELLANLENLIEFSFKREASFQSNRNIVMLSSTSNLRFSDSIKLKMAWNF